MKPFLKWLGNKYSIIDRIKDVLPQGKRLIEPFAGSCAVFLNTDYSQYYLADINGDLINLYTVLKSEGPDFIKYCKRYFSDKYNSSENYYRLRDRYNNTSDDRLKAALLLYLNKHGFNGLCRYNSFGKFNVAFGKYSKPYFPEDEMLNFYKKSKNATFVHNDFVDTMKKARSGDVIYCDPPYVPISKTANFTGYSADNFGLKEQETLVELARELSEKGIPVLISNQNTPFIQTAYAGAEIMAFDVQRFISCDGANRNKVGEVLAVFS